MVCQRDHKKGGECLNGSGMVEAAEAGFEIVDTAMTFRV